MTLPQPFRDRMAQLLGPENPAFLATYQEPRTHGLRANPLKIAPLALPDRLGLSLRPVPWAPGGFYYPETDRPGRHPDHAAGLYYIQEPSAMAAAQALAPQPGERVLDLCAAPGGKSTHLAALMQNQGLLVANEISPKRSRILLENLERLGVTCAITLNERPDRLAARFTAFFGRILVDAPCSGEGMFRKLPEACTEWSEDSPAACGLVQREVLADAVAMLRPGGHLLYSTCTFAPEENEQSLLHLLHHHPEMELVDLPPIPGLAPARPDWTDQPDRARALGIERAGRLWPHRLEGEGHFVALLVKRADLTPLTETQPQTSVAPSAKRRGAKPQPPADGLPRESAQALADFCERYLQIRLTERLRQYGEWLYQLPEGMPDLAGLHVLRAGLQLGEVRKGRFEPAHALAMALRPEEVRQCHNLPAHSEAALAYLHGEALPAAGQSGWTLVTVDGAPLGWAKASDGLLKNHYPKGLRWLTTGAAEPTE